MASSADPPDILMLSELYPPAVGGSSVLFENAYQRVSNYSVAVLTDATSSPGSDGLQHGVQVYRRKFLSRRWGVMSWRDWRDHMRTIRSVRTVPRNRATVIHCGRALPEGLSVLLGSPLLRNRYLCWAHGEGITTSRQSRELRFLIRRAFRNAAVVLSNSHNTRRLLQTEIGMPEDRIVVAQPGVDADRFSPDVDGTAVRRSYAAGDEIVLLTVGRLQRRKGHDKVLEALSLLAPEKLNWHYVIVGDGEERVRLESLTDEYGLRPHVTFAGKVPDEKLPDHYAACDIFVHPNREYQFDIEGFGIVFLEAQATGKPVIGGRSGGVPETLLEDETGLLVDGDNCHEIAGALRRLILDRDLCRRMGVCGRQLATSRFSWEGTARKVEEAQRLAGENC